MAKNNFSKRLGYVSIEVVFTGAIVLSVGFGGLSILGGDGLKAMQNGIAKIENTGVFDDSNAVAEVKDSTVDANGYDKFLNIQVSDINSLSDFDFEEDIANGGWTILKYSNQNDDDVVIPKFYSDGKPITKIGEWAFTWDYIFLDSVALPDSIIEIGEAAFYGSHISSLIIPNSVVTLGEYAFADNRIASLVIPASVRSIGAYGFMNNNMTNLDLPTSVEFIDFYAFNGNRLPANQAIIYADESNPIKIVSYGNTLSNHDVVIPNGVTTIGENAFFGVTINSITMSDTLQSIEVGAFTNITVLSGVITLPNSVNYIERRAFQYANVDTINLPAGITSIPEETFYESSIVNVLIPSSVTSIGDNAFGNNDDLASVQFAGAVPMNLGTSIFSSTPLLTAGTINVIDSYVPAYQAKALSNFGKPTTTFH